LIARKLTFGILPLLAIFVCSVCGQSSDQNFPSPVTESEVGATIRARDIGDSRLTTHYWAFDGLQGDIFINVRTENFSGDIDVYQAPALKPLTKMVMYADNGVSETGRVVYMRQPGRLLLRVQGRTPNDDAASYKIKFAGSFVALAPEKEHGPPTVAPSEDKGITVNSVGTIVAVAPKSTPPASTTSEVPPEPVPESSPAKRIDSEERPELPPKTQPKPARRPSSGVNTIRGRRSAPTATINNSASTTPKPPAQTAASSSAGERSRREKAADPAAGYRLVVVFKDGSNLEVSMADISRFGYEDGKLWIYGRNRTVTTYAIGLIESVTMK
jgi:hypothetical protein